MKIIVEFDSKEQQKDWKELLRLENEELKKLICCNELLLKMETN